MNIVNDNSDRNNNSSKNDILLPLLLLLLLPLLQEASGKLALKHYGDDVDGGRGTKRRAVARVEAPSLPPHFRPADISSTVKVRWTRRR